MQTPVPVTSEPRPVDTPASHIPKAFRLDSFCRAGTTSFWRLKEPSRVSSADPTFTAEVSAIWDSHRQVAEVSVDAAACGTSLRVSLPALSAADARDLAHAILKAADAVEGFEKRAAELRLS